MMYTRSHQRTVLGIDATSIGSEFSKPDHKEQWIAVCAGRLAELRPHSAMCTCTALALDLWDDVASFDPYLAAEMEHESCIFDD